jgi:hypothetical protein
VRVGAAPLPPSPGAAAGGAGGRGPGALLTPSDLEGWFRHCGYEVLPS